MCPLHLASESDDPRVLPDRLRLPFTFDTELLEADLTNVHGNWTRHYVPENYSGDWSVIPLRAPCGETDPVRMIHSDPTRKTFADTAELQRASYFRAVIATFQTTVFAARLMWLTPGSVINEHTDDGLRFEEGLARVHIPILTNSEVEFYLNGSRVVLDAGSCWYLRLSDPHHVANRGSTGSRPSRHRSEGERLANQAVSFRRVRAIEFFLLPICLLPRASASHFRYPDSPTFLPPRVCSCACRFWLCCCSSLPPLTPPIRSRTR